MAEHGEDLADVVVVYEQQEHYVQAAVEPGEGLNVDLLQCQILSLVGLLPEEQILVTNRGEIIASPFREASMALQALPLSSPGKRERLFVVSATAAKDFDQRVPSDWPEVCTRCVFGDLPIIQPAFRSLQHEALMCRACATTCGTDAVAISPLDWQSSKALAARFISEILVVAGDADVRAPPGFSKIPGDLNYSSSGDFVHLFVKRGGTRAISQLSVHHQPRNSKAVRVSGVSLPVDCNSGSASDTSVFLSYDTIPTSDHESINSLAVTDLVLVVGESEVPQGFVKVPQNLNVGNNGAEMLFLCYKLSPVGGFTCSSAHGAFGECLFQSRYAKAPKTSTIASGCSRSSDSVLANQESSRSRADSAFLETHYRQHQPGMRSRLVSGLERVKTYENPSVQAEALKRIPVSILNERARANPNPLSSYQDELVMQLTHWFKREFFSWMNQPKCGTCSFEKTQIVRTDPPSTPEEVAGQASRVEVYQCPQCKGFTRFPRYNDPVKLLDTRTGRCGEWANCFTLCCRAMGFEARYVLDVTDHVWTEVYSDYHKRWLHCDSCEDQLDRPLTYEVGWGKKLSYIFSFSHEEVVDTARRYTQNWDDMKLRRTEVSESWLKSTIDNLNQDLRRNISAERKQILDTRAIQEQAELQQIRQPTSEEVQGRVSGSDEWKSQRQEDGRTSSGAANAQAPSSIGRQAADVQLSIPEITQALAKGMLLGCDRGSDCNNPSCMHRRSLLSAGVSPTDRAARALQDVADIQSRDFSSHGLESFLCPRPGDIRDFILSQKAQLYLPLQDSERPAPSSPLVDISGHGFHAHTDAPLRKPFQIPGPEGQVHMSFGAQLLRGRKLTLPAPSLDEFTLSWLIRFDGSPHGENHSGEVVSLCLESSSELSPALAFNIASGGFTVQVGADDPVSTSNLTVRSGSYYHISVTVRTTGTSIVVNAKEVAQSSTRIDMKRGEFIVIESKAWGGSGHQYIIPVICHFAVLGAMKDAEVRHFYDMIKQRYVCWPPLEAYDSAGSRSDKFCSINEAKLQAGYRVSRVKLWGSEFFDGIQFVYHKEDNNGASVTVEGPLVGNHKARESVKSPTVEHALLPDEYLTKLSGRKGAWTDCIRLETNFGRRFACGGNGGGEFELKLPSHPVQIRAIQFEVGDHLVDAVAFVAEAPPSKPSEAALQLGAILESVDRLQQQSAARAVIRYLENVVAAPKDPKFQKIRASNKFFASSVGSLEKAKQNELMKWCGFNPVDEGGEQFYALEKATEGGLSSADLASVRIHHLKALLEE